MIDQLVQQFLGSGDASSVVGQLQQQGLSADQAKGAVTATAEGAAQAAASGGLAGMLGGAGGLAGAVGGLMGGGGGGGLGAMLGGLGGGGAPAAAAGAGGLPPAVVDTIAQAVASKTGISADMAKSAVTLVLPKVMDFVKSKMG